MPDLTLPIRMLHCYNVKNQILFFFFLNDAKDHCLPTWGTCFSFFFVLKNLPVSVIDKETNLQF